MFISYYTIIYFFIKIFFVIKCLYFSEYDIRMFLLVFWLRNRRSIKYVSNWGSGLGISKMFRDAYRRRGVLPFMCTYALILSFFMFCLMAPCFICRSLTLRSFKKDEFVRNGYFSQMRSISVVMNKLFFKFRLFFLTKVSQNGFNFDQIES